MFYSTESKVTTEKARRIEERVTMSPAEAVKPKYDSHPSPVASPTSLFTISCEKPTK